MIITYSKTKIVSLVVVVVVLVLSGYLWIKESSKESVLSPEDQKICNEIQGINSPEGSSDIDRVVNCKVYIHPQLQPYLFRLSTTTVEIYSSNKNDLVQEITPDTLGIFYSNNIEIKDDINFDGYKDLLVKTFAGARNSLYTYFIFDPKNGKFEEDWLLRKLPFPYFDKEQKSIFTDPLPNYVNPDDSWQSETYEFKNGEYELSGDTLPVTDIKESDLVGVWVLPLVSLDDTGTECKGVKSNEICSSYDEHRIYIDINKSGKRVYNTYLKNMPEYGNCVWMLKRNNLIARCDLDIDPILDMSLSVIKIISLDKDTLIVYNSHHDESDKKIYKRYIPTE